MMPAPLTRARRAALPLLVLIALLPSPIFAGDIIQSLKEKIAKIKTIQGRLVIQNTFQDKSIEAKGKLYAVYPDRFRMDLAAVLQTPKEGSVDLNTRVALDGKRFRIEVRRENSPPFVGEFDFSALQKQLPQSYYNPADQLSELKEGQIKVLGQTLYEGRPVYIISGRLKRSVPPALLEFDLKSEDAPSEIILWIGREDGVTYYSVLKDASGKKIGEVRFTSVKLNEPIAAEKFRFTPPADSSPVDLTETILQELKNRREKNK